ncbi:vomeronasal type-1 receptor 90-like, partial [Sciurus carolinensis]|uniref:vomeronasal type-1 receptor 90-like n=1 Tax=Sciurus carolinensis TaxID=30640 RepID=UPI001FB49C91
MGEKTCATLCARHEIFLDIDIFGVQDIWNDITCKAVVYLYRLMRNLSLSTTCMLSVLQAITLSPRSSFLAKFKQTSPQKRFMSLFSVYMVTLLCRHKRQCQHLHSTSLCPKGSPELRANRTILLLMGSFVVMYFVDCIFSSSSGMMWKNDPARLGVHMLVGNGYAA